MAFRFMSNTYVPKVGATATKANFRVWTNGGQGDFNQNQNQK
jgi:hypothetical protein